jgi:hypothetical protein
MVPPRSKLPTPKTWSEIKNTHKYWSRWHTEGKLTKYAATGMKVKTYWIQERVSKILESLKHGF